LSVVQTSNLNTPRKTFDSGNSTFAKEKSTFVSGFMHEKSKLLISLSIRIAEVFCCETVYASSLDMSKSTSSLPIDISWKELENNGLFPSARYGVDGFLYQNHIWLVCGAGAGLGKSSEIWKYSLVDKKWSQVEVKGDIPSSREGHSINFINSIQDQFLMFGGQGISTPNEKFQRQMDKSRSVCLGIREVFNDIYRFDIKSSTWSHVIAEGTFFPAGRRGHSCVYVGNISSSSEKLSNSLIRNHSLIMFGGAGFEIGKYSEQLYNDLWVYSVPLNKWERVFPQGEIPRGCYNHRAELVGEYMVVVGGILSPSPRSSIGAADNNSPANILLLNILTLTWSHIHISSSIGQSVRLNMQGHSMVRCSRSNPNKLLIFGGKESTDLKRAEEFQQVNSTAQTSTWELDVRRAMLTAVPLMEEEPEDRCGHLAVSAIPADELIALHEKMFRKNVDAPVSTTAAVAATEASFAQSMDSPRQRGQGQGFSNLVISDGKALVYIFGGSRAGLNLGGYCDPIIYQLTATPRVQAVRSPVNPHRNPLIGLSINQSRRRKQSKLSLVKAPSDYMSHKHHHQEHHHHHHQEADHHHAESGEQHLHETGLSSSSMMSTSLWESKLSQSKQGYRNPRNWSELKLALMQPVSKRTLTSSRMQLPTLMSPRHSIESTYDPAPSQSQAFDLDSKSVFSKNDMEEFYRTGLLLEHSLELSMIPPDYNPRDFMKLPTHARDHVLASSIASSLGGKIRGKRYVDAKKEYFRLYPPPPFAKDKMKTLGASSSTAGGSSFFTATGSQAINKSQFL
jgi:hypothetical protein